MRPPSLRSSAVFLLTALSAASVVSACSGSDEKNEVAGVGGVVGVGGSGAGGSGTGGSISGTPCETEVQCASGEFCSAAKVCAPAGTCVVKEDCASGSFCSTTQKCLLDGECGGDGDCAQGTVCDTAQSKCIPGGGCGAQEFQIEAIAPNMFISLDRSCSMNNNAGGKLPKTKWAIAVDAINKLTTDFNSKIRWGLAMFPDTIAPNCAQGAAAAPIADNNESKIQGIMTAALAKADPNFPDGPCVTNIDTAVEQASLEPALADTTRGNYVLLITDGAQAGCNAAGGDSGTETIIGQMLSNGVSTFVVGFGAGIDANQMNKFAVAGGVPANDPTAPTRKYYQADDAKSLDTALATIAGAVVGCSFALNSAPPDESKLFVFFDNQTVARDTTHAAGWDYDAASNTLTFYGGDCDKLKANQVADVDVVFGCSQPTPQ